MIDPRFYEHKEPDRMQPILAAFLIATLVFLGAGFIGSTIGANGLGCQRWLPGLIRSGHFCGGNPVAGLMWNSEYRWLPSRAARAAIARWPVPTRRAFYRALDRALIAYLIGIAIATLFATAILWSGFARIRAYRPMHKGTRFWASDEEVFATGLAVNYKPPLLKRIRKALGAK